MLRLAACKLVAGTSAARIGCRRQSRIKQVKQTWNVATRLASCISATSQLVGRPTSEQHLWQRMMISVAAPQLASVIPVAPGGSSTRPSLTRRKIQMKSAANQRAVSISVMPLLAGRRIQRLPTEWAAATLFAASLLAANANVEKVGFRTSSRQMMLEHQMRNAALRRANYILATLRPN